MKSNALSNKLFVFFALSTLLVGCAEQPLVYQSPAPVYRPHQAPTTEYKPEPAPIPAPRQKPQVETFKLEDAPIVSEEIGSNEEATPTAPAYASPPSESAATSDSAAKEGYSAPPVTVSGSPAVLALISDAERNSKAGNLDAAAVTIERALRIDSRNASLFYKLAQVRLEQNQPRLAEDLAKKAALLAENNRELKRNSWLLIAKARYMQGNKQSADEARNKAGSF